MFRTQILSDVQFTVNDHSGAGQAKTTILGRFFFHLKILKFLEILLLSFEWRKKITTRSRSIMFAKSLVEMSIFCLSFR